MDIGQSQASGRVNGAGSAAHGLILVVEDQILIALDIQDQLEAQGHTVVGPVGRVAAALELAGSESLDAAVLDINLGGEKVWPVAHALAERSVPFVFLSATAADSIELSAFADAPHLEKPFAPEQLAAIIGTFLASRAEG